MVCRINLGNGRKIDPLFQRRAMVHTGKQARMEECIPDFIPLTLYFPFCIIVFLKILPEGM